METKKRVSDVITHNDVESWKDGDVITISAGTGRGKSYFIKHILYKYAEVENKKILILLHRENCVKQFKNEIKRAGKQSIIDVRTYQSLEYDVLHDKAVDFHKYKYICADEFHYFLDDAAFNKTTDVSFNKILDSTFAIRIFMSATGEVMRNYINRIRKTETIDYQIPLEFSFIKSLTFFHTDESMAEFMREAIEKGDKAIFFMQKARKAYKLFRQFKDHCLFNCSKYNPEYYKYVDKAQIAAMLENERFETQFLITTSCFDAGANIIDKDVKSIVVDIMDVNSLIQCIGRRRIDYDDPSDKINLYIKSINNQQLGGFVRSTQRKIEMAKFLSKHTTQELVEKYKRAIDFSGIIYDDRSNVDDSGTCTKKVNELMFMKKMIDIVEYQTMIQWGKYGYCRRLAYFLGFYDSDRGVYRYRTIGEDYTLEKYLRKNIDKVMLQRKDRKELIAMIDVRSNGRQLRSLSALNSALAEREVGYRVEQFETSKTVNGQKKNFKQAWRIAEV